MKNNKWIVSTFLLIAITPLVVLVAGFLSGILYNRETAKPLVIHEVETVTVKGDTEIIKVPEPYPVIEERIVTKEVPLTLREFSSLEELKTWLSGITIWAGDCDKYAEVMQKLALEQGYLMSVQAVFNQRLNGRVVTNVPLGHMGCLTMIGNAIYYIEPQPPYEVVYICKRD